MITTTIVKGPDVAVEDIKGSAVTTYRQEDIAIGVRMEVPILSPAVFLEGVPS